MGPRGANHIARLRKADVEALLDDYDSDPVAALTVALRRVLDHPQAEFADLVADAPIDDERRAELLRHNTDALDGLLRELNELRTLTG